MYMLVKFADGSNPWYTINPTKAQAIKKASYFREKYGDDVYICFGAAGTDMEILHDFNGVWFVRHNNKSKVYKQLGSALNALIKEARA